MEIDWKTIAGFVGGSGATVLINVIKTSFFAGEKYKGLATVDYVDSSIKDLKKELIKENEVFLDNISSRVTPVLSDSKQMLEEIKDISKRMEKIDTFITRHDTEENALKTMKDQEEKHKKEMQEKDRELQEKERKATITSLESLTITLKNINAKCDETIAISNEYKGFMNGFKAGEDNYKRRLTDKEGSFHE